MLRIHRILVLLCLSLFALPGPALATGDTAPGTYAQDNGFNPDMLDASVPQAQRLRLFAHVIRLANQGVVRAQDLAGTIYWQGSKIQGSPVQANLEQARILLANAAVHGDVPAMAKLAELELGAGNPAQAMVWAQLYAHYLDPLKSAREHHGRRYAYASDLIVRIGAAGGKIDDKLSTNVGAMMTRFDQSIRTGITAFKEQRRSGDMRLIAMPAGSEPADLRTKSGVAEYMVAFDPSGAPTHVWLLASYPIPDFGTELRPHLDKARINPADDGTGTRYMLVPINHYSVKSRELRAHH